MSHRIYVYNFSGKDRIQLAEEAQRPEVSHVLDLLASTGNNDEATLMMVEWGYELPLFLYPLLADRPFIAAPLYNGDEGGLYAVAAGGKAFLKTFYDFIARHAAHLVQDTAAFEKARQQIFRFLDEKANFDFFHVDAWDVFNMEDTTHAEQAAEMLDIIITTNEIISRAIADDNPSLLDKCPDVLNNPYGLKGFKALFSVPAYDYGWQVIQSGYFEKDEEEGDDQVIYKDKESGKQGLKDKQGNVLVPARYDSIYIFPEGEEYAVAVQNGRFGFVSRKGEEVTGFIYDDAYDTVQGRAVVVNNAKHSLLRITGEQQPANTYDDLVLLSEQPLYYAALRSGLWGIIDGDDQVRAPFEYKEINCTPHGTCNFYDAKHAATNRLHHFTPELSRFGGDDIVKLHWAAEMNGETFVSFTVAPPGQHKKKLEQHGLADRHGNIILPAEYKEIRSAYDGLVILRLGTKYGMYSVDKGWLLECAYDRMDVLTGDTYLLARDKQRYLYLAGRGWLSPAFDYVGTSFSWDANAWETVAVTKDTAYLVTSAGTAAVLDKAGLINRLGSKYRHLYDDRVLDVLYSLAGDDLPSDLLFEKGAAALQANDHATAIRYYEKAAAAGNADAMNDLGFIYETVDEYHDASKAFTWYKKGADAGSPYAMNGLGACYENGTGVQEDITLALQWYNLAADKYQHNAHYNLGMLYIKGEKVAKDTDLALKHFLIAKKLGAVVNDYLGYVYEEKGEFEAALEAYKAGVREKDAYCAFNVARLYENGDGCKADPRKALSFFMKAAEWGMPSAHLELRRMYLFSETVQDPEKAVEHEALAREAGLEI